MSLSNVLTDLGKSFVGYNEELVKQTIGRLTATNQEIIEQIDAMYIINCYNTTDGYGFYASWRSDNAYKFYNDVFAPNLTLIAKEISKTITNVTNSINDAGNSWAKATGSTYYNNMNYEYGTSNYDCSNAPKTFPNGYKGMYVEKFESGLKRFKMGASRVENWLLDLKKQVENCGFIGDDVETELTTAITNVGQKVNERFRGIIREIEMAMTKEKQTYQQTSSTVSSNLSSIGIN